ncbi:YlxR family protein [Enhygromyxa salina]
MCVGCRARHAQSQLLRFGLRPGADGKPAQVTPTLSARRSLGGRSAYLCPRRACLDRAIKRRVFTRAFSSTSGRPRAGRDTLSAIDPAAADALWTATVDILRREIDLLDRCAEKTHAHLGRRGLERLLFELSSQPAPSDRRSSANRQGGTPTHG